MAMAMEGKRVSNRLRYPGTLITLCKELPNKYLEDLVL